METRVFSLNVLVFTYGIGTSIIVFDNYIYCFYFFYLKYKTGLTFDLNRDTLTKNRLKVNIKAKTSRTMETHFNTQLCSKYLQISNLFSCVNFIGIIWLQNTYALLNIIIIANLLNNLIDKGE